MRPTACVDSRSGKGGQPCADAATDRRPEGLILPSLPWVHLLHGLEPRASDLIFVTVFLSCCHGVKAMEWLEQGPGPV